MEETTQDILMTSLKELGISLPSGISSIRELSAEALMSICAQSLDLIEGKTSFSTVIPDSTADKFRLCTDIALAVKNLGYMGDITYYKFLYPSEEDLYNLVMFLVERLSESFEDPKASGVFLNAARQIEESAMKYESSRRADKNKNKVMDEDLERVEAVLEDLALTSGPLEVSNSDMGVDLFDPSFNVDLFSQNVDEAPSTSKQDHKPSQIDVSLFDETSSSSSKDKCSEIKCELDKLWKQENFLRKEVRKKDLELQSYEEELQLLKSATVWTADNVHPVEFYLEQLNEQLASKKQDILNKEKQWCMTRQELEEKKRKLEESLYADNPVFHDRYQRLKDVELEKTSILFETRKRVEELARLEADLERLPKLAPRRSHIDRIKEITKNSCKLDDDIKRISRDTKDLQLESNSFQERLHRTYALVDEMASREAKDPTGRRVHNLLTNIHWIFEQISEKILTTDKVRREITEYERKLGSIAARGLHVDKPVDLDTIPKENIPESLRGGAEEH